MRRLPGGARATIGAHLVALVAIQLVLVLGLINFAGLQDFNQARRDAVQSSQTAARLAAELVEENITSTTAELEQVPEFLEVLSVSSLCDVRNVTGEDTTRWFRNSVHLLNLDGTSICDDEAIDANVADAPWFEDAVAGDGIVGTEPLTDPFTGEGAVLYALAVPDRNLVVVFGVVLSTVGPVLDARFGTEFPRPSFLVTTAEGAMEIASSGGGSGRSLAGSGFDEESAPGARFDDLDGVERIFAPAEAEAPGWRIYAGVATADAFAAAGRIFRERIVFAGVILLIVLAAAFVIQRRFVRPIRSLAKVTKELTAGDLDTMVTPSGPVELSALAESFNAMVDVRRRAEGVLRKAIKAERRAADELREVDEMRNAFLMAISHELRTPLTSVVGYASMLKESRDQLSPEEVTISVDALFEQSQRLERLLLDLLDIERLSRGVVEPNLRNVSVRDVVEDVVGRCGANGRVKTLVTGAAVASVDPALVERIIENLVANAIKHNPDDTTVWVRASRQDGELSLTVEDDGGGIPDELKDEVFEPFKQGDVPSHAPGTGIGLALVSKFAQLHGGRAWVEDRRGGGASFRVVLPVKATSRKVPRAPAPKRRVGSAA